MTAGSPTASKQSLPSAGASAIVDSASCSAGRASSQITSASTESTAAWHCNCGHVANVATIRAGNDIPAVTRPDERWSIDFVHDRLATVRAFRAFTVIDDFSRECIALELDFSFSGSRVAQIFDRLALTRSLPATIKIRQWAGTDEWQASRMERKERHRPALHRAR